MHQTVLVVGAANAEELEEQLAPFYQLGCTMSQKEQREDPRAELEIEYTKDEAEKRYKEDIDEHPTAEQVAFFRENFIEPSDEDTCQAMYREKKNNKHAPNGYTGDDFSYGSWKVGEGEYSFCLISEENMKKCREWMEEQGLSSIWNLQSGQTREDFVAEYPDAHSYMTGSSWDLEWSEEKQGYGYWGNPNGFWDWYQVGGRWIGFFKIKSESRAKALIGEPSLLMQFDENDIEELKTRGDALTIGDIDFEAMEKAEIEGVSKRWDDMREMIFGSKPDEKSVEDAEKRFREIMNAKEGETKEEYVERNKHFGTASLLYDGVWYERPWRKNDDHDCVYLAQNKGRNDKIMVELPEFLQSLDDSTPLILVDCHR